MIKTEILSANTPSAEMLEAFKQYASVPDDSRDGLLAQLLMQACLKVQEMADKSILACTMAVTDTDADGSVRLYQSVVAGSIHVYVSGSEVIDFRLSEGRVYISGKDVRVTYSTAPNEAEMAKLMPIVYQYATALYDGANTTTLNAILSQC